jgi:hypothetical protein
MRNSIRTFHWQHNNGRERMRDPRPILVTTNHSGAAMEKLFSENIAAPLMRRLRASNLDIRHRVDGQMRH